MRTVSTDLFDLIHALSANDKRIFKLYAQGYGSQKDDDKLYIKLFDEIARQSTYDENILKEKLGNRSFNSQPTPFKNHLFNLIIKTLAPIQEAAEASVKINQKISSINFLYQKKVYKPAMAAFKRLWAELEESEEYSAMLFLLPFRHKLYQANSVNEYMNVIREYPILLDEISSRVNETARYLCLGQDVVKISDLKGQTSQEEIEQRLADFFQTPLLHTPPSLSNKSLCAYHIARCLYYDIKGDHESCYQEHLKIVEIWESKKSWQEQNPENWVNLLSKQCLAALQARRYNDLQRFIEQLDTLELDNERIGKMRDLYVLCKKLTLSVASRQIAQFSDRLEAFERLIKEDPKSTQNFTFLDATQDAFSAYFILGNHKAAFQILQYSLYQLADWGNQDSDVFFSWAEILLLIEDTAIATAQSKITGFVRKLKKTPNQNQYLLIWLTAVSEWLKAKSPELKTQILEQCRSKMAVYHSMPQYQLTIQFIDFDLWLQSKLTQKTLLQCYEEAIAAHQ